MIPRIPLILIFMTLAFSLTGQESLSLEDLAEGLEIDGGWDFYWRDFIDPAGWSLRAVGDSSSPDRLDGGFWDARGYPTSGYGSFVRHVRIDPELVEQETVLGIYVRDVLFAYRLYVNGNLLIENGKPSAEAAGEVGSFRMRTAYFTPAGQDLEILVHVSNHHDVNSGFRHPPLLALAQRAASAGDRLRMLDLFIFGALLIMALYHFGLYYLRPAERSPLYFGIFAISLALRGGLTGARFLHELLPGIPLEFMIDIEIIMVYVAAYSLNAFIVCLFGNHEIKWFTRILNISIVPWTLLALILGIPRMIPFHLAFEGLLIIESGFLIYYLVRAVKDRVSGSWVMLAGVIIIVLTVLNDIAYDLIGSGGLFLSSYGLFLFTFLQAFLVSRNFTRAFSLSEQFSSEMQLMANSFSRFVPREFLNMLDKESILHIRLGDQVELDMSVMFCDIREFTSLSEKMSPGENFNFINSYLSRISPVIRENHGFIDKYIGDGIMALFPGDPRNALNAAMALLQTLDEYNLDRLNSGYREIRVGIGINYGRLMLGTIGEEHRLEGTVISDTVNMASRLEQLTKVFQTDVIISEYLASHCREEDFFALRKLGRIRVKGKSDPVNIFELMGPGNPLAGELRPDFENALDLYLAGKYRDAEAALEKHLETAGEDGAARFYLQRIRGDGKAVAGSAGDSGDPSLIMPAGDSEGEID
jgi:adenylate cyclase